MNRRILLIISSAAGMALTVISPQAGEPPQTTCGLSAADASIRLSVVGSVRDEVRMPPGIQAAAPDIRVCKKLAAESVAYDPFSRRLFVANQADLSLDIYAIRDIFRDPQGALPLEKIYTRDLFVPDETASWIPDHVAVRWGVVALALSNSVVTEPGRVALLDSNGHLLRAYNVGARPDMLAYTPNGRYIVVANEGRPDDTYTRDPEGSITIIDPWSTPRSAVRTAGFSGFNHQKEQLIAQGVRIYAPCSNSLQQRCDADGSATVAQDFEPVFLSISTDSSTAWVNLESNNAIAKVDINRARVLEILPLGLKDHMLPGNEIDATRDEAFDLRNWPVLGMYMASAGAIYPRHGRDYLVTANRGNWREVGAYDEKTDVRTACDNGQLDAALCSVINVADGIPSLKIAKFPHRYDPAEFPNRLRKKGLVWSVPP